MAPTAASPDPLPPLHRAVVLTVLYGDLFDHPLTVDELHRFLVAPCGERAELERVLATLDGRYLSIVRGLVCRRGREAVIDVRRRRRELAAARWPPAERFARWLGRVPFLRLVAVCGSQAVDNGDEDGDVDLFLVTAPGRLWLVQAATMALRRAGQFLGVDFCPNYLLTTDALGIEERNLYTAREVAQVVPLWGREAYGRFLAANRWIEAFLPQAGLGERLSAVPEAPRHRLTARLERWLGGRLGEALDRAVHWMLLRYYRLRLWRRGFGREDIEGAYRRSRQVVITGGYAPAVARRFVELAAGVLGGEPSRNELESWFFGLSERGAGARQESPAPDPLYAGLLAARYGGSG